MSQDLNIINGEHLGKTVCSITCAFKVYTDNMLSIYFMRDLFLL